MTISNYLKGKASSSTGDSDRPQGGNNNDFDIPPSNIP